MSAGLRPSDEEAEGLFWLAKETVPGVPFRPSVWRLLLLHIVEHCSLVL